MCVRSIVRQFVTPFFSLKSPFSRDLPSSPPFFTFVVSTQASYNFFISIIHLFLTMDLYGRVPTAEGFQFLQDRFGFLPKHGMMISARYDRFGYRSTTILKGKWGFRFLCSKRGCACQPLVFFDMIVHHYDVSVDELTPSTVNKIVGFELICRSLGYIPTFWVFSYFFLFGYKFRSLHFSEEKGHPSVDF